MKNFLKLTFLPLLFLAFGACSDDDAVTMASPEMAPVLISPEDNASVILTEGLEANTAVTLVWNHAGYDVPTQMNYEVQYAIADGEFEVVGTTMNRVFTMTVGDLNTRILAEELPGGVATTVKFKVISSLGDNSDLQMESNIITLNVTPFEATVPVLAAGNLYLVGTATEFGFDNAAGPAMFRDSEDQYHFVYTGYLLAGELKILSTRGAWQPQYGTNDGTSLAVNPGGGSDPGAINVTESRYYTLDVNTDAMTFSLTPYDASAAPTYATVGITGSATPEGWPDNGIQDVNMTNSVTNPHLWKVTIALTEAEVKFRANDAWDTNWGGSTPISGMGAINAGNILMPAGSAGTYEVWFNDLDMRYMFIKQ